LVSNEDDRDRELQDYELDGIPIEPCEQCNGTGYDGVGRCACREEDDEATERRCNFHVIRANAHDQDKEA